jgi:hypothetical protein
MLRLFAFVKEMNDYTDSLPNADLYDIQDEAIRIWQMRENQKEREELGAFQAFDRSGKFILYDRSIELEQSINDSFLEEQIPIKVSVRQINIHAPFFGKVPTRTFEIVVLDTAVSEAIDPIVTKFIETEQARELL